MHLAYVDDSDTKSKASKWQIMSAVIIEDKDFKLTEISMSTVIPDLLTAADKLEQFEEFHACELYGGYGVFEGIEQSQRFDAILKLLANVQLFNLPVVYGAVSLPELQNVVYASADPLDVSFRLCMKGIDLWASEASTKRVLKRGNDWSNLHRITSDVVDAILEQLVIVICDECDKKTKDTLQKSFRSLRPPRLKAPHDSSPISNFHDDMYFGDSRYSIGIQMADLCSYFIARHLAGDKEVAGFYEMISDNIVFSESYPPGSTSADGKIHSIRRTNGRE